MILTTCAACAAPLAHTAPRCVRCHTRYCDATCQHDHWRRGHKQICKKIHRGGNAEQYYADKKYKEAVAVAVEACRGRHEGQKCYICLEAVHPRTGEGLVRGCACGDRDGVSSPELGVAHVSCLARQAKELYEEAEEINPGLNVKDEWFERWTTCSLCEQKYHGVVYCALGWACWKTYLGRPETDTARRMAIGILGNGLHYVKQFEGALSVGEAELAMLRRVGAPEDFMLVAQGNLATAYYTLGRHEQAIIMFRDVHSGYARLLNEEDRSNIIAALGQTFPLLCLQRFAEAKALLKKMIPVAQRVLGESDELTLRMRARYATALYGDPAATVNDLHEAVNTLEDTARIARRVLGGAHPVTMNIERCLRDARAAIHTHELLTLEAELAHDIYDPTLVSDADAWAARRELYLQLYRASELAGSPTFITPPPGCGEDEYQLRAELSE